ncbi:uncharacterized protein UV8b_03326 [Ustilaginoidea virens]|uniref:Uncharacterized protein n=1 Tax=Ustilaginoidea virens TaxID=1159556 RepID=A0A8E5HP55_USTVR|nr:uncharacterized protein UV8b_03326 [Ustilaginoidea virens]QUC19085.1 hypothetical protein UV8b_03326 [Ustilaginoidea virens]
MLREPSLDIKLSKSLFYSYSTREAATYTGKARGVIRQGAAYLHPGHPLCRKTGVVRAKGYHSYKELFGSIFSDYKLYANAKIAILALPEAVVDKIYIAGHNQGRATKAGAPPRSKVKAA